MQDGEMQAIGVPAWSTITSVSFDNRDKRASAIGIYDESGQLLGQADCTGPSHLVNVGLAHPVSGPATLVVAMLRAQPEREALRRG